MRIGCNSARRKNNLPKVNSIILWKNRTVEFRTVSIKDGKAHVNDDWTPTFGLKNFIPERVVKHWYEFWKRKSGKSFLLLKEDLEYALDPETTEFDEHWTKEEAKKHVAKQVSKARDESKPFTWWQIIFLLVPIVATLIGVLYIVSRIL